MSKQNPPQNPPISYPSQTRRKKKLAMCANDRAVDDFNKTLWCLSYVIFTRPSSSSCSKKTPKEQEEKRREEKAFA